MFERDGYIVLHDFLGSVRLEMIRSAVEAGMAAEGERSGWEQAAHFADRSGVPVTYFETSDRSKRQEMAKTFEKLQVVK